TLPPITNAPKLENLVLWGNKFSGNIPSSISNASMLKNLDLGDNLFSGPIPKTLGNLRHFEVLRIINNNLITGFAIDHEWIFLSYLANCRHLRRIVVSGNPLSDVLPTYIGNLSKSLQYFSAKNCELKGYIPMEIDILEIDLSSNHLHNLHAIDVGNLRSLLKLNLSRNLLTGDILSTFRVFKLWCHLIY
ncbi:hypothetical protein Godav_024721, partial [Gossypium davidsonii]|nr:hypothetical protein [Gossypium davidsonii]